MSSETDRSVRHWQPGETVVLRYLTRDGRPGMSWPFTVVVDRPDLVALYIPAGARYRQFRRLPVSEARERGYDRVLDLARWRRDTLRLMVPGAAHSVWVFWEQEQGERRHSAYYVNMEEPFRRSEIGFDTNDHTLDIVVTPDLSWRWKDDAELAERVALGVYPVNFAAFVRAEGERVIEQIEGRLPPFSDGWGEWQPDPTWPVPELPSNWEEAPVVLWDGRHWAYGAIAAGT